VEINGFNRSPATKIVFWLFSGLAVLVLIPYNKSKKTPLELILVDPCLLNMAMFCFVGGAAVSVIGIGVASNLDKLP